MTERPIIFSTPMVKAALAGTKTQTRRLTKLHEYNKEPDKWNIRPGVNCQFADSIERNKYNLPSQQIYIKCPYGLVGDSLWVRETWRILDNTMLLDDIVRVEYKADGQIIKRRYGDIAWNEMGIRLPAIQTAMETGKWMPTIHLPHIISRINLEITGVRVERLTEISEEDAVKEGTIINDFFPVKTAALVGLSTVDYFADLWDSINAKRGYGWSVNPWCWIIEFKMVTK